MDTPTFTNNTQYVALVGLLRRLHFLIAEGKGETDEADAIRDEMEGPWADMNTDERERTRVLSADLYTLDDNPTTPCDSSAEADILRIELNRACEAHGWEAALDLLRQHPHALPAHEAACWRGRFWNELGDPDTAALFFKRAGKLDPHKTKMYLAAFMQVMVLMNFIDFEG
jgi:hypothetical protein